MSAERVRWLPDIAMITNDQAEDALRMFCGASLNGISPPFWLTNIPFDKDALAYDDSVGTYLIPWLERHGKPWCAAMEDFVRHVVWLLPMLRRAWDDRQNAINHLTRALHEIKREP